MIQRNVGAIYVANFQTTSLMVSSIGGDNFSYPTPLCDLFGTCAPTKQNYSFLKGRLLLGALLNVSQTDVLSVSCTPDYSHCTGWNI